MLIQIMNITKTKEIYRKQKSCESTETCFQKFMKSLHGGFQLLDLIITELKSHITQWYFGMKLVKNFQHLISTIHR